MGGRTSTRVPVTTVVSNAASCGEGARTRSARRSTAASHCTAAARSASPSPSPSAVTPRSRSRSAVPPWGRGLRAGRSRRRASCHDSCRLRSEEERSTRGSRCARRMQSSSRSSEIEDEIEVEAEIEESGDSTSEAEVVAAAAEAEAATPAPLAARPSPSSAPCLSSPSSPTSPGCCATRPAAPCPAAPSPAAVCDSAPA
eukprot:scaffold8979_cov51-Phaeocystis_antarctica.AAC.2